MPAVRSEKKQGGFPCLDGYRAIAALLVVVYHVGSLFNVHARHPVLGAYTDRFGNYGVAIFFILSGFLLYRPFASALVDERPTPSISAFFRNRSLRIFPAYWVALTALIAVFGFLDVANWKDAITWYSLTQSYRKFYALGGLRIAWTLSVELTFYIVLPFIALAIARVAKKQRSGGPLSRLRVGLASMVVLYVTTLVWRYWSLHSADLSWLQNWLPNFFDWFALGMTMALLSVWSTTKGRRLPPPLAWLARHPWVCWLFALEFFWLLVQLDYPRGFGPRPSDFQVYGRYFFTGMAALFLLIPGFVGPQHEGSIRRTLQSWPIAAVGLVSYGIYLWHTIWLRQAQEWISEDALARNFWTVLLVVLILTVATATLSYWVVERPALSLKRRTSTPEDVNLSGTGSSPIL